MNKGNQKIIIKNKNSLSNKIIPSKEECSELNAWHLPWNKRKYKKQCTKKKCIWQNSILGSYCKDPITVTEENIKLRNLDDEIYLATLSSFELHQILKKCNKAGEKYLNKITKKYLAERLFILRDIVKRNTLNYLVQCSDEQLVVIVKNAKQEKIKRMKRLGNLLIDKEEMQEACFITKLGYDKKKYQYHTWEEIEQKLHRCGIHSGHPKYMIAFNIWDTRNRPVMELRHMGNHNIKIVKKITKRRRRRKYRH